MQNVERAGWVNAFNSKRVRIVVNFTKQNTVIPFLREVFRDVFDIMHDADIEMISPEAVRIRWRQMPVVLLLVIDQYGRLARRVDEITIRCRR